MVVINWFMKMIFLNVLIVIDDCIISGVKCFSM